LKVSNQFSSAKKRYWQFTDIYDDFRDKDGAYTGMYVIGWANIWNTNYIRDADAPKEYTDFLKPEFKDKLVLTYPNDDDAVLYQFNLMFAFPQKESTFTC
jgi:ABC-type Fe3+ transport system substrate-binding protein